MPPRPPGGLADHLVSSSTTTRSISVCSRCIRRYPSVPKGTVSRRSFSATSAAAMPSLRRQQMFKYFQDKGAKFAEVPDVGSAKDAKYNRYRRPTYLARFGAVDEVDETMEEVQREIKKTQFEIENMIEMDDAEEETQGGLKAYNPINEQLRPFPLNPYFYSEPVLSDTLKDNIWKMVKEDGKSVRQTSVELGIDMNRIGAVIRLKGVERSWMSKGKPLASSYARAITEMLPVTRPGEAHESINDLPIHRATKQQIFYPTSESRSFTRADAGQVFENGLLPADARIPHPQLVQMHRELNHPDPETSDPKAVAQRMDEAYANELQKRQAAEKRREEHKRKNEIRVEGSRATFRIQNVTVDENTVGPNGRGRRGVGARYGMPHEDRKKGQVKIPTRVGVDA